MKQNKLPKQWKHWVSEANLKLVLPPKCRWRRKHYNLYTLQGRGRYWRVNCFYHFECGDTYKRFDRWALSDNIVSVPLPKTKAEFLAAVEYCIKEQNDFLSRMENSEE